MSTDLDFDRIYYFGDSLTDSDEFFAATSAIAFFGLPPLSAGYDGQFSNGDVYADLVPDLLGIEGGEELNYAVGTAQVLTDRTIGDLLAGTGLIRPDATAEDLAFRIDYGAQAARFLADTAGEDLSTAAVSVLIGVNDFDDIVLTDPTTAVADTLAYGSAVATATLTTTLDFAIAGVGTIILNTIPDARAFPTYEDLPPQEQALAPLLSLSYNATLRTGAEQLEALGANVVVVEWGAMMEEIDADFESFGFRFFDEQVLLGIQGSGGINPAILGTPIEQIGFYDSVHPTAELHEIMGAFQAESLTSDVRLATDATEMLDGGKEDDLILARGGDDVITLGNGDDIAIAGLGQDTVAGGNGADLIAGGAGDDEMTGGNGDDIIADGTGDDSAFGGNGNDLLIDGGGSDMAFGGNGDDLFIFTQAALQPGASLDDMNHVCGGNGQDTLVLRLLDVTADLGAVTTGDTTTYAALGLSTSGIENVVLVAGLDVPAVAGFEDALETADYWHFV